MESNFAGVFVCPHHNEILQNTLVPIQGLNRHEYIAASSGNCVVNQVIGLFSTEDLSMLYLLAQDAQFLLENQLPPQDMGWFRRQYISALVERGLATATGRVYRRELMGQFLHFYSQEVLNMLDSHIEFESEQNWLLEIVRKHRKVFHPIRHLLMLRFLGLGVCRRIRYQSVWHNCNIPLG